MENIEFESMETSISILVNDIWQNPDWVDWYEDELQIQVHPRLRVDVSLVGLGGSRALLKTDSGQTRQFSGMPVYDMGESLHKDLSFLTLVIVDVYYLLEEIRRVEEVVRDKELSDAIVNVAGPMLMFLEMALTQRPELIKQEYWGYAIDALKTAGFKLKF